MNSAYERRPKGGLKCAEFVAKDAVPSSATCVARRSVLPPCYVECRDVGPAGRRDGRSRLRQMCLAAAIAAIAVGCTAGSKAVLNQQAEAHRLASHLRVEFTRAADASNLAVMADTDEASSAAAREAQQATQSVERDVDALKKVLDDLGDRQEAGLLDKFTARFDEYRKLDETILPLAVENTNIKAQRLAFGPGQQAVDEFQRAIDAAARPGIANNARVAALAAQAVAALLEVQVLQARHIAESSEAEMSRMETSMKAAASQGALRRSRV